MFELKKEFTTCENSFHNYGMAIINIVPMENVKLKNCTLTTELATELN